MDLIGHNSSEVLTSLTRSGYEAAGEIAAEGTVVLERKSFKDNLLKMIIQRLYSKNDNSKIIFFKSQSFRVFLYLIPFSLLHLLLLFPLEQESS